MSRPSLQSSDRRRRGVFALAGLIAAAFFAPLLRAGLYMDDLHFSVANHNFPGGLPAMIAEHFDFWLGQHRFLPVNVLMYTALARWVSHDHHLWYHALQVVVLSLCVVAFLAWVRAVFPDRRAVLVALGLVLCASSINPYQLHDPFAAYHLQQPAFFLCFFSSVMLLQRYLDRQAGGRWLLLLSLALYAVALGIYEVAYPLILVFAYQVYARGPRRRGLWLLYGGLFVGLVVFQVALRLTFEPPAGQYTGTALNLAPPAVIKAYVNQLFSAVPLAWLPGGVAEWVFERTRGLPVREACYVALFLAAVALAVLHLRRAWRGRGTVWHLSIIGLLMWVLPPLVIAVAAKYQFELDLAGGYLPRYFQLFGMTLVALPYLLPLRHRWPVMAALVIATLLTFGHNLWRIDQSLRGYRCARLIHDTLRADDLLARRGVDRLFVNHHYLYDAAGYRRLNPRVPVISMERRDPSPGDKVLLLDPADPPRQVLAYWGTWGEGRVVRDLHRIVPADDAAAASEAAWTIAGWAFVPLAEARPFESLGIGVGNPRFRTEEAGTPPKPSPERSEGPDITDHPPPPPPGAGA